MRATTDNLASAFDRIEDFQRVQAGVRGDELCDAVALLQESVGIRDSERELIRDRVTVLVGAEHSPGELLLGMVIGLMAGEES